MEISINYIAVLVAAIANMTVGMFWYGPLFGKKWMALMRFTPESIKSMKLSPTHAMAGGFVGSLITAYVLAHFVLIWGVVDAMGALTLAFWIWLGFVATTQIGGFLWEGKSFSLFLFNTAASLASLVAMALTIVTIS